MGWTAPRTWVSGETPPAALLNQHIRDNLLEEAPAKVTTLGDMVRATGANALERFGGLVGQYGRVVSGAPAAADPGPIGILGVTSYNPATSAAYTVSARGMVDLDATNLAVAFTAPASGNVIVLLSGYTRTANAVFYWWGLREGTSTIAKSTRLQTESVRHRLDVVMRLSGISAGPHTYKWSHEASSNLAEVRVGQSGPDGPGVIIVMAAA